MQVMGSDPSNLAEQGWLDKALLGKPYGDDAYIGQKGSKLASKVHGIKFCTASGFFGERHAILTYDPAWTITSAAFGLVPHLTIFFCPRMWRRQLLWLLWTVAVGLCSAYIYRFPADQLRDPLEKSSTEFRFLMAVVLGSFIGRALTAWKERRKNYAALCGTSRALAVTLATYLPLPTGEGVDQPREVRLRLGRYVSLALELAMLKARGKMDDDQARIFLLRERLLEDGEWEAMQPGDRHTTVLFWISIQAKLLCDANMINERAALFISDAALSMRANANDLMSSLDRDLPYPYASVVGALVNFVCFLQASKLGLDVRIRYMEEIPDDVGHRRFVGNTFIW